MSVPLCTASDSKLTEPVSTAATIFVSVAIKLYATETAAARFFNRSISAEEGIQPILCEQPLYIRGVKALPWIVLLFIGSVIVYAAVKQGSGNASSSKGPWMTNFDTAQEKAKKEGKLMLVDFNAEWCGPCKLYEEEVFPTAAFKEATQDMVLVDIDVDVNVSLADKYGVSSIPDVRILSPEGNVVGEVRGYGGSEPLLDEIRKVKRVKTSGAGPATASLQTLPNLG